ncbi:YdcF family protein [Tellurirhabdus rosea]|uniref:YdcF family protein n=1 Tax=Tellurirhabdus rosea TaxID=2674997 RepID=UPI002257CCC3|nr:YdcF family protein [Tellurirhabdus rosea]
MFYFLSKVLAYFLSPAGWLTLLMLTVFFVRDKVRKRRLFGLLLISWFVLANEALSNELARWWEYAPTSIPAATKPRVGIVLTGGMMQTEVPPFDRVILGESSDRMGQALGLYQTGLIQKILISGGSDPLDGRRLGNEGQLTAEFLRKAGVKADDIILENKSRNTEENARFSAAMLKRRFAGYEYVLITSAFHMRRAVGCFRKQALSVRAFPAAFMAQQRRFTPDTLLLPSESALWKNYRLFHEWFGYGVYWGMGYL